VKLLLVRDAYTLQSTLGKLYVDGNYQCETLEDCDRQLETGGDKVQDDTAIPRGTYKVTIDFSTRFGKDMPHVLDVPQFTGIRFHPGNSAYDTHGCVLVGLRRGSDYVSQSVVAFTQLYVKLDAAIEANKEVTLEVR